MKVIFLGNGGHARVLRDMARLSGLDVIGYAAQDPDRADPDCLGDENWLLAQSDARQNVLLVNAVGSVAVSDLRAQIYDRFVSQGFSFASVFHPSAIIADGSLLSAGLQIMAGAIIQPGCAIGANTIMNTGAQLDHDCLIGDHVHIAPGTVLSGNVNVGAGAHLGTGSVVIQSVTIGARAEIAAGTVVTTDIAAGSKMRGVPAQSYGQTS